MHYSLPLTGKKADKVRTIVLHLASHVPMVFVHDDEDDEEFEAREEVILAETDSPEISEESELDDNETKKKIQILMSAIKLLNFKVSLMPRLLNVGELSEDAAQMTIYFTDSLNIHLIV